MKKLQRFYFVNNIENAKDFFSKKTMNTLKSFVRTGQCLPTAVDTEYVKLKAILDCGLLDIIKLDEWCVNTPTVKNVIAKLNGLEFQKLWGVELKKQKSGALVPKKFSKQEAMTLINEMFEMLSVEVVCLGQRRDDGKQVRYYALDNEFYQNPDIKAILDCLTAKYTPEAFVGLAETDTEIQIGTQPSVEPANISTDTQLSIFLDMFASDLIAA